MTHKKNCDNKTDRHSPKYDKGVWRSGKFRNTDLHRLETAAVLKHVRAHCNDEDNTNDGYCQYADIDPQ